MDHLEKSKSPYQPVLSVDIEEEKAALAKHNEENVRLVNHNEEKDSDSSPNASDILVIPPDGGWGWVVVIASFLCNLIVDGIIFSFATFLDPIAKEFDLNRAEVTLVGSLMSGFYLMAGPFASAIANGYGFRIVAIFGSVFGTVAFGLSYFATDLKFLCVTYGLLGGIGFGLIYVPSIISIGFYFERWRALATGIAVCGSGIGTFVFAPLSEFLIEKLGWRGALLCQGAIVLSCVIYGSLFRPLEPKTVQECELEETNREFVGEIDKVPQETKTKLEEAIAALKRNSQSVKYIPDHQTSLPVPFRKDTIKSPRIWDIYHHHDKNINTPEEYTPEKTLSVPFLAGNEKSHHHNSKLAVGWKVRHDSENHDKCETVNTVSRKDVFYGGSLARLPQYTSKSSVAYNLSVTKIPMPITEEEEEEEEKKKKCKIFDMLLNLLDFSLMKSPSFIILAVGGFFTMMGFYVPYMYLVSRADPSLGQKAVWLISSIGIANTIGRVLCGVISSLPGVNALFVTNVALTVGGLATMLSGLSLSAGYQFTYTVLFGLATSCFASLRSIVVVDLLGLDKLTNAFGLLLLFQGMAAIIGAPLAGAFMNLTGNYNSCFYLSGGVLLFSAVMCYPLNRINRWEKKKLTRSEQTSKFKLLKPFSVDVTICINGSTE